MSYQVKQKPEEKSFLAKVREKCIFSGIMLAPQADPSVDHKERLSAEASRARRELRGPAHPRRVYADHF